MVTATAVKDPQGKVEEFKQEAGEAVGEMPPKPPTDERPKSEYDPEIVVDGSGQLGFDIGGKRPTDSELRVVGGAIKVRGQFEKGQVIEARITLRVGEVAFRDKRDSQTDQVVDVVRAHKARIVAFTPEKA